MPSTFSPALRLELIGNGEQAANWGNTTNTNLGSLIEQAITGVASITMGDANYTLVNGNGVVDEARNAVLVMTGTLSATRSVIVPTSNKFYAVRNATTGSQSILVRTSAGTGVTLANGFTQLMYCDGTNVVLASVPVSAITGAVVLNNPTINGFTGDTSVINVGGGQFYKTTGGNVGIGTSSPAYPLEVYRPTGAVVSRVASGQVAQDVYSSYANAGGGGLEFLVGLAGAGANPYIWDRANRSLIFGTNNSQRMQINNVGNVGIGTASPAARLAVAVGAADSTDGIAVSGGLVDKVVMIRPSMGASSNNGIVQAGDGGIIFDGGSIDTGAFVIAPWASATSGIRIVGSSGNVGIGTATPTQRLDVSGNTAISGNLSVSGTITVGGNSIIPPGVILEYGGGSPPSGWLACDGSAVSRTTYLALYNVIGTTYGAGDGVNTFNLPDRRDRFGVGAGSTYARGSTGGAASATTSTNGAHNHTGLTGGTTLTTAQIPSHTHTGTTSMNGAHNHGALIPLQSTDTDRGINSSQFSIDDPVALPTDGVHNHGFTTDPTGGGGSHDHSISTDGNHNHTVATLPPYVASNYIIKI